MRILPLALCLPVVLGAKRTHHQHTFTPGEPLELRLYLSESPRFRGFNASEPVWVEQGIPYLVDAAERTREVQVPMTPHLLANGTLFAHAFFTRQGYSPDPSAGGTYDPWATTMLTTSLVAFAERQQPMGLKKLLTGEPAPWEEELRRGAAAAAASGSPAGEFISYWKPALHLQLVVDPTPHALGSLPPLYDSYLQGYRLIDRSGKYKPLVYSNELTVMRQHWQAINGSRDSLPLELSCRPMSLKRFQWIVQLDHSFSQNEEALGISSKESEDLRGMFVHTSPTLLYTTIAVSAVHLLFDLLAFKSDVSFWTGVDSMEGLSSRSLLLNFAMEAVVLLYLVEEQSSWLVQVTSVLSLVLGVFKILKSTSVRRRDATRTGGHESLTDKYDRLAFTYLLGPLLFLVVGYSAWCLVTAYFRSWYSWLLESLVALVYGCGFIVMTPQLFINWRLQSVAHLPWKFFMYKALNTFIDDLFAFIIKMPTLHRMSCFRDDIVFAVFLYQRWAYKVDHSRVNEFGQRGDQGGVAQGQPARGGGKRGKGGKKED